MSEKIELADRLKRAKADAWLHPTADWAHKSNGYVAAHCHRGGPRPMPLYAISAADLALIVAALVSEPSHDQS